MIPSEERRGRDTPAGSSEPENTKRKSAGRRPTRRFRNRQVTFFGIHRMDAAGFREYIGSLTPHEPINLTDARKKLRMGETASKVLDAIRAQIERDGGYNLKAVARDLNLKYSIVTAHLIQLKKRGLITQFQSSKRLKGRAVRPVEKQHQLVRGHYPWVDRFVYSDIARRSGIDFDTIRGMAHEKLMRSAELWEHSNNPERGPAKFSTYLWKAFLNGLTNLGRKKANISRRKLHVETEKIAQITQPEITETQLINFTNFVHALHKTGYLSEQHAMAVVLRNALRWKFRQISHQLGLERRSDGYKLAEMGNRIAKYFVKHDKARKQAGLPRPPDASLFE
ncbi:MAG: hypothetical protein ABH863_05545 [Candidatus Micrarchaeota archaeon]